MCFHCASCIVFVTAFAVTSHLLSDADYCLTHDLCMDTTQSATTYSGSQASRAKYAKHKVKIGAERSMQNDHYVGREQ